MAKGRDKHQERRQALSLFGKDLTRRAGSQCELCEASGVKLVITEVPPVPKEPDFAHCLFTCESCSEQIDNPKRIDSNHWRCLNKAIWSELLPVQVTAILMLRRLEKHDWAAELLDQAYITNEAQIWLDSIKS